MWICITALDIQNFANVRDKLTLVDMESTGDVLGALSVVLPTGFTFESMLTEL